MAKSSRPNWILRIAGVLLCLTLLSTHFTSGMMARYSTTVSGSDSARVAKFEVKQTGTFTKDLYLEDYYPGFSQQYTIVLENRSEVAVQCKVTVEKLSDNMPIQISFTPVNEQLAPNDTQGNTYNLTISWPSGASDAAYSYEVDAIRIRVDAVQVD